MKKLNALAVTSALIALAGCSSDEPATKPVEQVDAQAAETKAPTPTKTAPVDDETYTLKDDNGTVYTLDLGGYSDKHTKAADKAIAEAMAFEAGTDAGKLDNLTKWASLTIDNTKSSVESGSSYVDIKIVGDENQYGIITDASGYVAEMTWMSAYGDQAEADTYNRMLDIADALSEDEIVKPGVKVTYPVVLETGLPETVESVWCWDLEMK